MELPQKESVISEANTKIFISQVNVPLISNANLYYASGLPFLENVPDIPHFPVLWIDLGFSINATKLVTTTTTTEPTTTTGSTNAESSVMADSPPVVLTLLLAFLAAI